MPDIVHLIRIQAFPERVYLALTTAEGLRNWWTQDADLSAGVGGEGVFRFHEGRLVTKVCVDALALNERVAWSVISSFRPDWADTTIVFDLWAEGEVTALRLSHCGFAKADDDYAVSNTSWAYYLVSLQRYLQTGTG